MRTICDVALWRVVGSAEPHPNMCISNGSILLYFAQWLLTLLLFYQLKAQAQRAVLPSVAYYLEHSNLACVLDVCSNAGAYIVVAYAYYTQCLACILGQFLKVNTLWNIVAGTILYGYGQILCYDAVYLLFYCCYLFAVGCCVEQVIAFAFFALDMCIATSWATIHSYHCLVKNVLAGVHGWVLLFVVVVEYWCFCGHRKLIFCGFCRFASLESYHLSTTL